MPLRKSPGSSKCMTSFAPDRSTPSESPSVTWMPNTPEHQPWSGLAGPKIHGHIAAQLHDSSRSTFKVHAITGPLSPGNVREHTTGRVVRGRWTLQARCVVEIGDAEEA